jgi:hypothetical protein
MVVPWFGTVELYASDFERVKRRFMLIRVSKCSASTLLVVLLAACTGQEDAEGDALCEDAAQAVAQQTVSCGGDIELGNSRYEAVLSAAPCIANVQGEAKGSCSVEIKKLTCDEVETLGDDVFAWINRPQCSATFDIGDGGVP